MLNPELIIFTHIPKTAGTSTRKVISDNYPEDSVFKCYVNHRPSMKPLVQQLIKILNEEDAQCEPLNNDHRVKLVAGHFGFGFHEILPPRSFRYITILRNPIERVISLYYHVQKRSQARGNVTSGNPKSLKEFIMNSKNIQIDNLQTRLLAGYVPVYQHLLSPQLKKLSNTEYGECSSKMLEVAKRNLRQYYLFGLQDKYEESIRFFAHNFGWQNLESIQVKVNPHKGEKEQPDQEILNIILENNQLDIALYDYAKGLYDKQLQNLSL